jgi:hypothetical protein
MEPFALSYEPTALLRRSLSLFYFNFQPTRDVFMSITPRDDKSTVGVRAFSNLSRKNASGFWNLQKYHLQEINWWDLRRFRTQLCLYANAKRTRGAQQWRPLLWWLIVVWLSNILSPVSAGGARWLIARGNSTTQVLSRRICCYHLTHSTDSLKYLPTGRSSLAGRGTSPTGDISSALSVATFCDLAPYSSYLNRRFGRKSTEQETRQQAARQAPRSADFFWK